MDGTRFKHGRASCFQDSSKLHDIESFKCGRDFLAMRIACSQCGIFYFVWFFIFILKHERWLHGKGTTYCMVILVGHLSNITRTITPGNNTLHASSCLILVDFHALIENSCRSCRSVSILTSMLTPLTRKLTIWTGL